MVGVHMLIGIGEALITGLTVGAVLATRPDLVYGARDLRPVLVIGAPPQAEPQAGGTR
jgi:cobalt/nickel transport system permease protein